MSRAIKRGSASPSPLPAPLPARPYSPPKHGDDDDELDCLPSLSPAPAPAPRKAQCDRRRDQSDGTRPTCRASPRRPPPVPAAGLHTPSASPQNDRFGLSKLSRSTPSGLQLLKNLSARGDDHHDETDEYDLGWEVEYSRQTPRSGRRRSSLRRADDVGADEPMNDSPRDETIELKKGIDPVSTASKRRRTSLAFKPSFLVPEGDSERHRRAQQRAHQASGCARAPEHRDAPQVRESPSSSPVRHAGRGDPSVRRPRPRAVVIDDEEEEKDEETAREGAPSAKRSTAPARIKPDPDGPAAVLPAELPRNVESPARRTRPPTVALPHESGLSRLWAGSAHRPRSPSSTSPSRPLPVDPASLPDPSLPGRAQSAGSPERSTHSNRVASAAPSLPPPSSSVNDPPSVLGFLRALPLPSLARLAPLLHGLGLSSAPDLIQLACPSAAARRARDKVLERVDAMDRAAQGQATATVTSGAGGGGLTAWERIVLEEELDEVWRKWGAHSRGGPASGLATPATEE